jgi:hypothetical protein
MVHDAARRQHAGGEPLEYAELELYLTQLDNGKPLSVPGIRH